MDVKDHSAYNKPDPTNSYAGSMSRDVMGGDYDYGAFKMSGQQQSDNGHYPDTYKLPNHMTFSEESQYSGKDGNEGGHWSQLGEDRWSFKPGATNYQNHSSDDMQDYFKAVEPGSVVGWQE